MLEFDDINLKSIEQKYAGDPDKCCREIFYLWINGKGVKPCTWEKLIELIDEFDESNLAEGIKSALSSHTK